ncbi:uncharacterized protein LOC122048153 [Zingiber officinale]|uniref:uncharacterized protein LOC122048153 n=1 Tax=Zingiber officinale TaxID=94328 RepID=UPI001C4DD057|nr:uncharacterized protein LOC122048153 [Zingiber officinale]
MAVPSTTPEILVSGFSQGLTDEGFYNEFSTSNFTLQLLLLETAEVADSLTILYQRSPEGFSSGSYQLSAHQQLPLLCVVQICDFQIFPALTVSDLLLGQRRSSCDKLLELDPEIERTFRALRIQERTPEISGSNFQVLDNSMAENNLTMKELAAPDMTCKYSCITYPGLSVDFELRSGLIHLLPKFQGLPGEDPNRYLHEFHVVCSTMKPQGISEEDIKLRAFPFSLSVSAKEWW